MNRRRLPMILAALACAAALTGACYRRALVGGEAFAFRDASQYFDPLHRRIQQEWDAGRLPLWLPDENAGAPLLANPTAAVLYPGKLLFAALPHAWAARCYVVLHTWLACGAMVAFGRGVGMGGVAATLAGLAYAFGAVLLSLNANVVYLVGAAWLPLGFLALDGLLRRGWPGAAPLLSAVLAMQVLGGDPQAAYLTVLCGAVYAAAVLLPGRSPISPSQAPPSRPFESLRRGVARVGWLAAAAGLGLALAAVQVVPSAELVRRSFRAGGGMSDPYRFAVEPLRLIELAWPDVTGRVLPENHSWLVAMRPGEPQQFWVPSLYLGGLTVILAATGATLTGGPPARRALTILAPLALLASLGRSGGIYPALLAVVPGWGLFRYPGKLLPLASFALGGLAGFGWDRITGGARRRAAGAAIVLLSLGLSALASVDMRQAEILRGLAEAPQASSLAGPVDPAGALADLEWGLAQGSVVNFLATALAVLAPQRPRLAGLLALLVMTLDLAFANAGLVWTVPQADLDRTPEAARRIAEAEEPGLPAAGPRVFRMPVPWHPRRFFDTRSPDRLRELVAWERDTLQPSHALATGLGMTLSPGILEEADYLDLFRPSLATPDPATAARLGVRPGSRVASYPRRVVDLWASRYLILPARPDWGSLERGYAAFLDGAEPVHPAAGRFEGVAGALLRQRWIEDEDWQLLRNRQARERASVVHDALIRRPLARDDERGRARLLRQVAGQEDAPEPPGRVVVELGDPRTLAGYLPRTATTDQETAEIVRDDSTRLDLTARLERPGLVVLADTYDPGWTAEIDGHPAPILRVNRTMRGLAVREGTHRIVFRYRPASWPIGLGVSTLGLAACLGLAWRARRLVRRGSKP